MKFAMHVITKYKQQLGKRLFVFAASRPYNIMRLFKTDVRSVVMPQAKCRLYVNQTSFSVPSMMHRCFGPFYTGIDTYWQSVKWLLKGGPPGSRWVLRYYTCTHTHVHTHPAHRCTHSCTHTQKKGQVTHPKMHHHAVTVTVRIKIFYKYT